MSFDTAQVSAELAARGLRLTRQRRAVLDAIAAAPSSLSALQVYDAARAGCPELGLTTVYRTLDVLAEMGALRRVHGPDHCESFVPASAAHGHTVVCSACGRVTEFTGCDMRGIADAAAQRDRLPHHRPLPAAQRAVRRLPRRRRGARGRRRVTRRGPLALLRGRAARCSRPALGGRRLRDRERRRLRRARRRRLRRSFLADIAQNVAGDRFTVRLAGPARHRPARVRARALGPQGGRRRRPRHRQRRRPRGPAARHAARTPAATRRSSTPPPA